MAVLKPRKRLVNFRLSDEEYGNLRMACALEGARSISDFARGSVLRSVVSEVSPDGPIQTRLSNLDRRVGEIESNLRYLTRVLEAMARRGVRNKRGDSDFGLMLRRH